ncbi:uncharacterized protein TM35_000451540, partial [Trypanosoma theileri]
GGALRVRPAAESEWLTCGAGSRVSACGKYADLCRQRTARATTTISNTTVGQPKAVMAIDSSHHDGDVSGTIFTELFLGLPRKREEGSRVPPRGDQGKSGKPGQPLTEHRAETGGVGNIIREPEQSVVPSPPEVLSDESPRTQHTDPVGIEEPAGSSGARSNSSSGDGAEHSAVDALSSTSAAGTQKTQEEIQQTQSKNDGTDVASQGKQEISSSTTDNNRHSNVNHRGDAVSSSVISAPQAERSTSTNGGGDSAGEHTETQQSNPPAEGSLGSSNNTGDKTVPGDSNLSAATEVTAQESASGSAPPDSQETNSTTQPSPANTVNEESTATPSRDSNLTQQSTATDDVTAAPNPPETNTTTLPSTENNVTEAPTTTPSPVPNAEINTIASAVQKNKANVDSSVSPVWMHTAAPLLIVAVLFSVTVY